jgi:hypothetical protein
MLEEEKGILGSDEFPVHPKAWYSKLSPFFKKSIEHLWTYDIYVLNATLRV